MRSIYLMAKFVDWCHHTPYRGPLDSHSNYYRVLHYTMTETYYHVADRMDRIIAFFNSLDHAQNTRFYAPSCNVQNGIILSLMSVVTKEGSDLLPGRNRLIV